MSAGPSWNSGLIWDLVSVTAGYLISVLHVSPAHSVVSVEAVRMFDNEVTEVEKWQMFNTMTLSVRWMTFDYGAMVEW
jgi:hypothetical protein